MTAFEPTVYAERRATLDGRMREQNVDVLFCPPSGDLEYLTGARRRYPTFGNISYTHGWVCGAFFRPGHDPVFVLPRMVAEFDMPTGVPGEFVVVKETDDGAAMFDDLVRGFGQLGTIAVEPRTWAETVLALGRASEAKIVSGVSLTNPMRRIKSPAEIERMAAACRIADSAMGVVTADVADGAVDVARVRSAERRQGLADVGRHAGPQHGLVDEGPAGHLGRQDQEEREVGGRARLAELRQPGRRRRHGLRRHQQRALRDPKQGGDRGVLMAFRESDGEFLWQHTHEKLAAGRVNDWPFQGVARSPLVEGDRLYYVSNRGDADLRSTPRASATTRTTVPFTDEKLDRPDRRRRGLDVRHDGGGRRLSAQPRQLVAGRRPAT